MTMKKTVFSLLFLLGAHLIQAQVGINTTVPDVSAALDIVSVDQGVLVPRMTTGEKNAITNPANGLLVYDITQKEFYQNAGTSTVPVWVTLGKQMPATRFFYMPSIAIDVSVTGVGKTLDLYEKYKDQFNGSVTSEFVKSASAPASIPYFPSAASLDYYITRYDTDVLENVSISDAGVMTYDIKAKSNYKSFMNVVFVVK